MIVNVRLSLMANFMGILDNLDPSVKNILMWVVPIFILYFIFMIFYMKRQKGKVKNYLDTNPDASLILLKSPKIQITGSTMIESVDGESPVFTSKGMTPGVYIKPGTRKISAVYTDTQVKITKNVHRTWGPELLEIEVEPRKSYYLYFDTKAERFEFVEDTNLES